MIKCVKMHIVHKIYSSIKGVNRDLLFINLAWRGITCLLGGGGGSGDYRNVNSLCLFKNISYSSCGMMLLISSITQYQMIGNIII